jgi:branched-subunit amino acid permease
MLTEFLSYCFVYLLFGMFIAISLEIPMKEIDKFRIILFILFYPIIFIIIWISLLHHYFRNKKNS